MNLWRLIFQEILHRKTGFLLGLLSVTVAMTAWIGAPVLLQAHDRQTDFIMTERARATQEEMHRMEDDYRLITRDLGHNVMIVAGDQDLSRLRALGHPEVSMPFEYVERLGTGGIETLNHLLPVLQKRVQWAEHDVEIILSGTPGQIPVSHRLRFLTPDGTAYHNPIMESIPHGELVLGHNVAHELNLEVGDQTELMGHPFRVRAVNRSEGTSDDIAVWCHLDWMQDQLGMQGEINVILALECICEADALGRITADVKRILQDVQVMEFASLAKARALARNRAAEAHRKAMDAEREHRREVADAYRRFTSMMTPLVVLASAAWMVFLFLGNVRERIIEIGVLRAIGVGEQTILSVFLVKSLIMGLAGALLGFFAGHALGAWWVEMNLWSREFAALLNVRTLLVALVAAPALCMLAAWFPAVRAVRKDPARILCEA